MIFDRIGRAALWLSVAVLAACGGGGGGGGGTPDTPAAPSATEPKLATTTLKESAFSVPVAAGTEWLFSFTTPITAAGAAALVELRSDAGTVPVDVDVLDGQLRVRPSQELRLRTDYTLTLKAGLKAANGAVSTADVVRHFRTLLFDGAGQRVIPGNVSLTSYPGSHTLRLADVNGDGRTDIVQIGGDIALQGELSSFAINIFLQNPDHTFTRSQNLLVHEPKSSYVNAMGQMAVVDLDLDGRPEIVVGVTRYRTGPSGLMLFKQDSQGLYVQSDFLPTPYNHHLFMADVDHDGRQDLLAVGAGATSTEGPDRCGVIAVLSDHLGPQVQPETPLPCGPYDVALGSLQRAGQLDLVLQDNGVYTTGAPNRSPPRIYTLDAQGRATSNQVLTTAAAGVCGGQLSCAGLMLMDIDGDGLQDLMISRVRLPDTYPITLVFARDAAGLYKEFARRDFGEDARAFMIADVDRDGRDDIAAAFQPSFLVSGVVGGIGYARSKAPSGLEMSHRIAANPFDTMTQDTVAVGDIDGDGLPDFALDSYNSGVFVVLQRKQ